MWRWYYNNRSIKIESNMGTPLESVLLQRVVHVRFVPSWTHFSHRRWSDVLWRFDNNMTCRKYEIIKKYIPLVNFFLNTILHNIEIGAKFFTLWTMKKIFMIKIYNPEIYSCGSKYIFNTKQRSYAKRRVVCPRGRTLYIYYNLACYDVGR